MGRKYLITAFFVIIFFVLAYACTKYHYFRMNYSDANSLIHAFDQTTDKPFLKAHLKNGDILILKDNWKIDTIRNFVIGNGAKYDFNRKFISDGYFKVLIDSVSIFETNFKLNRPESGRIAALTILSGFDIVVLTYCLINPKACYGSCPTFYLNADDNFHYADAEGFSNAVSPSLEYADIDALNNKQIFDEKFSITMKNEAFETHCINDVKLLAYPRNINERIYQTPNNHFYLCENIYQPTNAYLNNELITNLLIKEDKIEQYSSADENNMNSREEIILTFKDLSDINNLGFRLDFRQTLMSTYIFYSAMGYMGDEVSDIFALIENDESIRNKFDAALRELGGIEVYLWNEKNAKWQYQNEFNETGPIAINKQIVPIKNSNTGSDIKLKLVLNKGLWRLDFAALTNIKQEVKPIEISPSLISNKGIVDISALNQIIDPDKYLISMPGNEFKFDFILPDDNTDYELFIYSKGYYLEWMREKWIKDKNMYKLDQMVNRPNEYLKEESKNFKEYEKTMEESFRNSKINTKTFSKYEK